MSHNCECRKIRSCMTTRRRFTYDGHERQWRPRRTVARKDAGNQRGGQEGLPCGATMEKLARKLGHLSGDGQWGILVGLTLHIYAAVICTAMHCNAHEHEVLTEL